MDACFEELLIRGLDDWIQAAEVASVVRTTGHTTSADAVRDRSLELIRRMLHDDLFVVGDVKAGVGFVPWTATPDVALQRIESEWRALPDGPDLGEVCWLNLTPKGRTRADEL